MRLLVQDPTPKIPVSDWRSSTRIERRHLFIESDSNYIHYRIIKLNEMICNDFGYKSNSDIASGAQGGLVGSIATDITKSIRIMVRILMIYYVSHHIHE